MLALAFLLHSSERQRGAGLPGLPAGSDGAFRPDGVALLADQWKPLANYVDARCHQQHCEHCILSCVGGDQSF